MTYMPMFKETFIEAEKWTQPKCSLIVQQMNKMWYTHTMKNYLSIKGKETVAYVTMCTKPQNHHAKLYAKSYNGKSIETESGLLVA